MAAIFPEMSARNGDFLRNNVVENPYIAILVELTSKSYESIYLISRRSASNVLHVREFELPRSPRYTLKLGLHSLNSAADQLKGKRLPPQVIQ